MSGRLLPMMILLLIAAAVTVCGCTGTSSGNSLPKDEYVALQETIYGSGHVIEGNYPYPGMAQPPVPFDYRGPLNSNSGYPEVNDSLKILYGVVRENDSEIGLTYALDVSGIYAFPYPSASGPVITGVDKNGTVLMTCDNQSISLGSGETWNGTRTDVLFDIVNVTVYSWVDVRSGNNISLSLTNHTTIYNGVRDNSSQAVESINFAGTPNSYAQVVNDTTHPADARLISDVSYMLQTNVTYQLENLGMYDKAMLIGTKS